MTAIDRTTADRTTVMVTHRLRLAGLADRVVVVDGGRITEVGTAEQLLSAGGTFARLWEMQASEPARGG
jgi:ATP-binding cassette subfamily B protein